MTSIITLIFSFTLIFFFLLYPFYSLFKKINRKIDPCERYARIKKRIYIKKEIFDCLVNNNYEKNHLQWYIFKIKNETITLGIIELLSAFGDDIFKKVSFEQKKRKKDELKNEYQNKIIDLNKVKELKNI